MQKQYKLWYDAPAPNRGRESDDPKAKDPDWEAWSLPLAGGHFGVNMFGRTDTERMQVTEASLANPYPEGINNFAEVLIDFHHPEQAITNYTRDLVLNDATAHVCYDYQGVTYRREYLTSHPDAVLAVKLTASAPGCVSFTLRPEIPYLQPFGEESRLGKTGTVAACGQTITLSGEMEHYGILYEGQIVVQHSGGSLRCDKNKLVLENADEAVIWMALGTNYQLCEEVFRDCPPQEKLMGNPHPHERIAQTLAQALSQGYDNVRERHVQDYQQFFNRVQLNLGGQPSPLPTNELLNAYIAGKPSRYLEELYFQYGRYLLIASSRKGTLPGNLQGLWNQYYSTPWSGGYWHNINIQMNYWHAFTTNLAEMFESYSDMNRAFRKRAQVFADDYLKLIYEKHPNAKYAVPAKEIGTGQNGWAIGTGSWPCHLSMPWPEGHSGPGQGGLTTKLFWDYYDYTRDEEVLKHITYPALSGMSDFLSRTVIEQDGCLLVHPSMSPEQRKDGVHYRTTGCAFDQQMLYENHKDCIAAAELLGIDDDTVRLAKQQIGKLEPVIVGACGQVKEYREEEQYGDIGEYHHRHISHLVALSPGQTINPNTSEWMQAARVTLTKRGDESTGWAMAHRLNAWARARDGQRAYTLYQTLLKIGTLPNLWDTHPPFQIDGNFGGTAGVAEMLLQSNGNVIEPLPALPHAWPSGSFAGLVARGNFVVGCTWENMRLTKMTIHARRGGVCTVRYPGIDSAQVTDENGKAIHATAMDGEIMLDMNANGLCLIMVP